MPVITPVLPFEHKKYTNRAISGYFVNTQNITYFHGTIKFEYLIFMT